MNINLAQSTGLNELEFTNVAAVNLTNGTGGSTLTVTNAGQSTVHGMALAGRAFTQTIDYASTSGTADVAALSVAGTGSSTTNSVFNVEDGNTIESVTLATSGTNYVTVNGGTGAAKYTLTGNGTNNLTVGSAATTMTIDASATTGTNVINVGTLLSTTDSVYGGSGFDVLQADLTSAVQMIPTIAGVEELELTFTAATIFNASKVTGATDLEITPVSTVDATITNLNQTVDHVYVGEHWNGTGTAVSASGAIAVGYATGSNSDVTFDVGATATNSNPAVSIGAVTFSGNAGALHVHSSGDANNTIAAVTADKASSLHIHGETQALTITNNVSAANAADVTINGELKNTSVGGTLAIDSSTNTLNLISGASTATLTGLATLTAGAGEAVDLTANITSGAKAVAMTAGLVVTGNANDENVAADVNIAGGAGAVTVGTLSFVGGAASTMAANVSAEATDGAVAITTVLFYGHNNNQGGTVSLSANGGDLTLTNLDLTSRTAAEATVLTSLELSAASGNTLTVTDLKSTATVGTEGITSVTITGAGTVNLDPNGNGGLAASTDTVVDATGLTGALTMGLNAFTGNLNVTLGNVVSGSSNSVTTGTGADVIVGGTGADSMNGGEGADNINGGAGVDTVTGGVGADYMVGGSGADVFNYTAYNTIALQTGITIATADLIGDFVSGTDTIKTGTAGTLANYLEAAAYATYALAKTAADAAFTADSNLRYFVTSSTADGVGLVFVDAGAGGTADAVIKLTGISASNFAYTDIVA